MSSSVFSRMNRRIVAVERPKQSLCRALGINANDDAAKVLALAFLRHKYASKHSPTTPWGMTQGYLLYGVLEYIVQTDDDVEENHEGAFGDLWNYILEQRGTEPYKTLLTRLEEVRDFNNLTETKKLSAFINLMISEQLYIQGFEGNSDVDTLVSKVTVSIAKKGFISDQLVARMNEDMIADKMINGNTPITSMEIKKIYEMFGKDFVKLKLHKDLGEETSQVSSMRIELCRKRIQDCSLTTYRTIKRAIETVGSFPWDNFMRTFDTQAKKYKELMDKLSKDKYYGFSSESSEFGSALVGDLYYISKKLLVEHMGDENLGRYTCKAKPTNYPLCEAIYREFKTQSDTLLVKQAKEMFQDPKDKDGE